MRYVGEQFGFSRWYDGSWYCGRRLGFSLCYAAIWYVGLSLLVSPCAPVCSSDGASPPLVVPTRGHLDSICKQRALVKSELYNPF